MGLKKYKMQTAGLKLIILIEVKNIFIWVHETSVTKLNSYKNTVFQENIRDNSMSCTSATVHWHDKKLNDLYHGVTSIANLPRNEDSQQNLNNAS